jgi:hypothetical protein
MHRYIKIPLFFMTMWVIIRAAPELLINGFTEKFIHESLWGLITGGLLGFGAVYAHDKAIRRLSKEASDSAFDVKQSRRIVIHSPYEVAFDLCKKSVAAIEGYWFEVDSEDRSAGKIEIQIAGSWAKVYGSKISYDIRKISEQITEIRILSRPASRITWTDKGENFNHVEKICKFLSENDACLSVNLTDSKLKISPESEAVTQKSSLGQGRDNGRCCINHGE